VQPTPLTILVLATALLSSGTLLASGQQAFDDYFEAKPPFWRNVYPEGGKTLYCGEAFGPHKGRSINVEHVYPMSWVMKAQRCGSRDDCRRHDRRFNQIEADMHNFYPSRKDINKARSSFPFGTIKGEHREYGHCDFEFDPRTRKVEPRPTARGNIARAMFYMQDTYDLKIYRRQGKMLQRWNREDPPDREEQQRNDRIEAVQGNRNRFIDHPQAADRLRF